MPLARKLQKAFMPVANLGCTPYRSFTAKASCFFRAWTGLSIIGWLEKKCCHAYICRASNILLILEQVPAAEEGRRSKGGKPPRRRLGGRGFEKECGLE